MIKGNENNEILRTGDLAKIDVKGNYFIVGRKKRFSKIFGLRINLDDLEEKLNLKGFDCACSGNDEKIIIFIRESNNSTQIKDYIKKNFKIIGVDSLNDYYNLKLKKRRIKLLKAKNFIFLREDLASRKKFFNKIRNRKFDYILHFAAQPGVRYSLKNPESYIKNNILAFSNILDLAKIRKIDLVYASSSSIYGNSKKFPIKENFKSI